MDVTEKITIGFNGKTRVANVYGELQRVTIDGKPFPLTGYTNVRVEEKTSVEVKVFDVYDERLQDEPVKSTFHDERFIPNSTKTKLRDENGRSGTYNLSKESKANKKEKPKTAKLQTRPSIRQKEIGKSNGKQNARIYKVRVKKPKLNTFLPWLQEKMSYYIRLSILAYLIVGIRANLEISVDMRPMPAVLGENVQITCTFSEKINWTSGDLSWSVVKDGENTRLFIDDKPSNTSLERSYESSIDKIQEKKSIEYVLRISNFTIADTNYKFRCELGFLSKTKQFPLNETRYIYRPEGNDIELNISKATLKIVIRKIFPEPICTVNVQGHGRLNMNTTTVQANSSVYSAELNADLSAVMICDPQIQITCSNGNNTLLIMNRTLNYCKEHENSVATIMEILVPGLICVGMVVFIGICVCVRVRKNRKSFDNKYQTKYHRPKEDDIKKITLEME